MKIPIQNIYYLLCYAWNKLDEQDKVAVSVDDQTELVDLFAKVLINAAQNLFKRGIDQSYVEETHELAGIKGKLAISESLKQNLFKKQRTICLYDEFSPDILTNQILVGTLRRLIRIRGLNEELKWQIRKLVYKFPKISHLAIKSTHFKQIRLHRNNRFYDFIMKVCQIIHENILPGEEPGTFQFADFTRNERKMNQLFEAFIFQFYTREQDQYKVRREHIKWQLQATDEMSVEYLPLMKTDITLENANIKIIMDAKYYRETLASNYDKKKIKSVNLYQLFSYLLNQEKDDDPKTLKSTGILVYPTIDQEYTLSYRYRNHNIRIRTLNLNQNWQDISSRLLDIIR